MGSITRRRFIGRPAVLLTIVSLCGTGAVPAAQQTAKAQGPHLEWDAQTRVRVCSGTYGRMVRLNSGDILCSYEGANKAWVTRSRDDGKTWDKGQIVRSLPFASAANPELLVLHGGRILLLYNQRPRDKTHPFAISACWSDTNAATWHALPKNIYEAGINAKQGCWEPAAVQTPSGEIHLFFANEFPYPKNNDQEITRLRSRDEGRTWDRGETVCLRPGHRDGMPVPLLWEKEILVAIEDNGLKPGYALQPAVILVPLEKGKGVAGASSSRRWEAVDPPLPARVYAGAPYLKQLPTTGETILSCQSTDGGRAKPQMVVYVGDRTAHHFGRPSVPFDTPPNVSGNWNALFIKNARTVTAISETTINGVHGVWAIDGHLVP